MTIAVRIPGAPPMPNQSTKAGSWHARAASRRDVRETRLTITPLEEAPHP